MTDQPLCADCGMRAPTDDEGQPLCTYTYAKQEVALCRECYGRRG